METARRGASVFFSAAFLDQNGAPITPTGADLHLSYQASLATVNETVAMDPGAGGTWVAEWDSGVADAGRVWWHIRSTGAGKAVDEGHFELTANNANPGA